MRRKGSKAKKVVDDDKFDEQKKMSYFRSLHVVKGKILTDLELVRMVQLCEKMTSQGWLNLFSDARKRFCKHEVREFYTNYTVSQGAVTTIVKGLVIQFDCIELGERLGVPSVAYSEYLRNSWPARSDGVSALEVTRKFAGRPRLTRATQAKKQAMQPFYQLIFEFVLKNLLQRLERRSDICLVLTYMDLIDREVLVNLHELTIKHIRRVADMGLGKHALLYGFLLGRIFLSLWGAC